MTGVIGEAQREMEEENRAKGRASTATRPSLKSDSQFNKYQFWKQKLRENCYKRVREDRTRLLWKIRLHLPASHSRDQDQLQSLLGERDGIVRAAFEDIVSDEFNKMSESQMDDDPLWEYEGPPPPESHCQDILLEMQRIFYEDLKSQPLIQGLESEIETWEDEVDEYLARAVYEHMQLNTDKAQREEIWCPICKRGALKDSHNLIHCTCCELQLNKANELTLDFLRDRLAEVHIEHLDRGCRLKPRFCMKTKFNLTALYISCEACETFEVVI